MGDGEGPFSRKGLPPVRSPLTLSEHHLVHLQLDLVEIDFTAVSCAVDSLYEPTPLERFCNWSPVCLRVTVFAAFLVFLEVVGHGLHRRDRTAGLLRLNGQHLPVLGFALVGLAERTAQNGGRFGKPALDFGITLIKFGAGDALGLVVLKGGPELAL